MIPGRSLSALTSDATSHGGTIDRPRQWYRGNGGRSISCRISSPVVSLSVRVRAALNLIRVPHGQAAAAAGRRLTTRVPDIHPPRIRRSGSSALADGPPRSRIVISIPFINTSCSINGSLRSAAPAAERSTRFACRWRIRTCRPRWPEGLRKRRDRGDVSGMRGEKEWRRE